MKTYNVKEKPIEVFGIPFFEEKKIYERLPEDVREKVPSLSFLGRRCPGARIGFKTDAEEFTVKVKLETLKFDLGMSIYGCQSMSVMIGERQNSTFAGLINPPDYETKEFERTFKKSNRMEEVTIWFLRNEIIESIEILIPDNAKIEAPTPYKYGKALYYGSSITEGAHSTVVTNTYTAILSRWLDLDYYNFGFSGSAKGELEIADYIATLDINLFVYDYDFNAPDVKHLKETHEKFFRRIREKRPDLPVLMMSRPSFDYGDNAIERRQIVLDTYKNAIDNGDKNVYFADGETFFGEKDRHLCTTDTVHPNDLGAYRMAEKLLPIVKNILK